MKRFLAALWLLCLSVFLLPSVQGQAIFIPKKIADIAGLQSALNARPARYEAVVWDDWTTKANGAVGTAGSGQAWSMTGLGGLQVSSAKLVNYQIGGQSTWTSYISADAAAGKVIKKASITWTFEPGDTGAVVMLGIGKAQGSPLSDLIHVICSRSSMTVQIYTGGGVVATQSQGQYIFPTPLAADSVTEHTLSYELVGNVLTVALPNGKIWKVTDTRFSSLFTTTPISRVIAEIQNYDGTAGRAEPRILRVAGYTRTATEAIPPYLTHEAAATMLANMPQLQVASVTFSPTTTGWYRIISGNGGQVLGTCYISTNGQFLGNSIVDAVFDYTINLYEVGIITPRVAGSIGGAPSVGTVRTSYSGGLVALDIEVKNVSAIVPITVTIVGLYPGAIVASPVVGATAGTNPVTYAFP